MADPIDQVDDRELFARGAVPADFVGVEGYLGHYQQYWEEIEERKKIYESDENE